MHVLKFRKKAVLIFPLLSSTMTCEGSHDQQINDSVVGTVHPVTRTILLTLPRPSFLPHYSGVKHTLQFPWQCSDSAQHPSFSHNALVWEGGEEGPHITGLYAIWEL